MKSLSMAYVFFAFPEPIVFSCILPNALNDPEPVSSVVGLSRFAEPKHLGFPIPCITFQKPLIHQQQYSKYFVKTTFVKERHVHSVINFCWHLVLSHCQQKCMLSAYAKVTHFMTIQQHFAQRYLYLVPFIIFSIVACYNVKIS